MKYRHLFYLYVVILLLTLSHLVKSESHSNESPEAKTGNSHPPAESRLSTEMVAFLTRFVNSSEQYFRANYFESLPNALEKAIQQNDEGGIAAIMAVFVGQLHDQELRALQNEIQGDLRVCRDSEPANLARIDALKRRLLWATTRVLPIENTNSLPCGSLMEARFNEAFDRHFRDFKFSARDNVIGFDSLPFIIG